MEVDNLVEAWVRFTKQDPQEFIPGLKGEDGQWKDDALDTLNGAMTKHIKTIGDNQFKRGIKQKGKAVDNRLRELVSDAYDLPDDAADVELIEALWKSVSEDRTKLAQMSTKVEGGDGELTLDDVLGREDVRNYVRDKIANGTKELQDKYSNLESELNKQRQEAQLSGIRSRLYQKLDEAIAKHKIRVAVKDDPEKSARRLQNLRSMPVFDPRKWSLTDKGDLIPVDQEGNPLQDEDTFDTLTVDQVLLKNNIFPIDRYDDNGPTPAPAGGSRSTSFGPLSAEKYLELRNRFRGEPEKLIELGREYAAQQDES